MSVNLQQQIRDNSRELNDYLRDLSDWTGAVKEKDRALLLDPSDRGGEKKGDGHQNDTQSSGPPPVRGRVNAHHVKSEEEIAGEKQGKKKKSPSPVSSSTAEAASLNSKPSGSSKDAGNACFKTGDYTTAIAHYTRCIEQEGGTCAAYANRAMCSIKLGRWGAAEADCTQALRLDPAYLKAHQRRGISRRELGKFLESTTDFEQALRLEPNSKILATERNTSKTAYELEAHLRPTQARRVVKITVPTPKKAAEMAETSECTAAEQGAPLPRSNVEETSETYVVPPRPSDLPTTGVGAASRPGTTTTRTAAAPAASSSASKRPVAVNIVAPRTGAEFEAMWNALKADPDRRLELVRVLSPDAVSSVFKSGVSTQIFIGIVRICLVGYEANALAAAVPLLAAMTQIPRFDMAVMFISGGAKKDLQAVWDRAAAVEHGDAAVEHGDSDGNALVELRKKYKL